MLFRSPHQKLEHFVDQDSVKHTSAQSNPKIGARKRGGGNRRPLRNPLTPMRVPLPPAFLKAPIAYEVVRSRHSLLATLETGAVSTMLADMAAEARALAAELLRRDPARHEYQAEVQP